MNEEFWKNAEVAVEKLKLEDSDLLIVTVSKDMPSRQAVSLDEIITKLEAIERALYAAGIDVCG